MFKGHPKGLFVLFTSNMGERFGYYTMLAIFVLYLQEHFAWSVPQATNAYGFLLAGTYIAAIIGGIISDKLLGYGKTVLLGFVVMTVGYGLLAKPIGMNPTLVFIGIGTIAIGVGLFKANIAVITGNLYEDPKISHLRDSALNIFYMGINVGAFFAPFIASGLKNFVLKKAGFIYNAAIPKVAHEVLSGETKNLDYLQNFFNTTDLSLIQQKAAEYLKALSNGYNLAFGVAALAIIFSLVVFVTFRKHYQHADFLQKDKIKSGQIEDMPKKEVKDRLIALSIVFVAAIVFFTALNMVGGPLLSFAKSYTQLSVSKITNLLFNPLTIALLCFLVIGIIFLIRKNTLKTKIISIIMTIASAIGIFYMLGTFQDVNKIGPELFSAFNPLYILILTPIVIAFFAFLNKKRKEPSSPSKMIWGLLITAISFGVLLLPSFGLPRIDELVGNVINPSQAISPYFLIIFYLGLTLGELFISPIGLSFVSRVAPPKLRGSMQAGWLVAMGVGGYLAGASGKLIDKFSMVTFCIVMGLAMIVAAVLLFVFLKKILAATK